MPVREVHVKKISNGFVVAHYVENYARKYKGDMSAHDEYHEEFFATEEAARARQLDLEQQRELRFRDVQPTTTLEAAVPVPTPESPAMFEEKHFGMDVVNQLT